MKTDSESNFFDKKYLDLYLPILTEERTLTEVEFLIKNTFDASVESVLDMPCGFGRHSKILAEKGYRVHGVDSSPAMLEKARDALKDLSKSTQKRLSYELADMREFASPATFDAALNLFTSFGYFDNEENEVVLKNLCGSVRRNGVVVIDLRNPLRDISELSVTGWRREESTEDVRITQTLDPISMRHSLTYHYKDEGIQKEKNAVFREYSLPEMQTALKKNNCQIEKIFGNFRGDPYSATSSRLIIVARKA